MKLLVLGASGACGSHVVRLAVARGHEVTAVARPTSTYRAPAGASLLHGEVLDDGFVAESVSEHETVISCLGLRRSSIVPWSRLLSPPTLVRSVMGSLVKHAGASTRVSWISAGGVGDSRTRAAAPIRVLIDAGNVGTAYRDLEAAEQLVLEAGRPWLAVRPVTLLPGGPSKGARPVDRYGLFSVVRRGDVAEWMLDSADGTRPFDGPAVMLGAA
ncbi:MAG: NAD(P)H-binding protein [Gemmatimonadota bacterium]